MKMLPQITFTLLLHPHFFMPGPGPFDLFVVIFKIPENYTSTPLQLPTLQMLISLIPVCGLIVENHFQQRVLQNKYICEVGI